MFVVALASVEGGKLWLEYQVKQIVELNREEAKLQAELLSLVDERKVLTKEINGMKIQKLRQLESEKIQVMISGSEMYLVFPEESAKPELYLSTEDQWVVKRRMR
jgi:cell division protein FtsB